MNKVEADIAAVKVIITLLDKCRYCSHHQHNLREDIVMHIRDINKVEAAIAAMNVDIQRLHSKNCSSYHEYYDTAFDRGH